MPDDDATSPLDGDQPEMKIEASGEILAKRDLLSALGRSNFVPTTEATRHLLKANAKTPAVRIIHRGGPAERARVYINGEEAKTATRVEVVLDANDSQPPRAWVQFHDVDLDVTADQADAPLIVPGKRFFWPVLFALILDAAPAGLAAWMWQLSGWLPDTVFVLCVIFAVIWTLGVLGALFGLGRLGAAIEPDDGEAEQ